MQKVLKLLREMQSDASLIEWQAAIEQAVHKLSRAKLHDLFLPSAVRLVLSREVSPSSDIVGLASTVRAHGSKPMSPAIVPSK